MLRQRPLLAAACLLAFTVSLRAQAPSPPPPKEYDVQLRYRIRAGRNERLIQYFAFLKHLERVGFQKNPGPDDEPENPTYDRMTGRIASSKVRDLLQDKHVKGLLLFPADYKLPEDPEQPVKVQIELAPMRSSQEQRLLSEQTRERLQELGFRDSFLYDHRQNTRLLGYIPGGQVMSLFRDLRMQPDGWFTPVTPVKALPLPLQRVSPIVIAEVLVEPADVPAVKEPAVAPPVPRAQEKIAPGLRALLGGEEAGKPRRLEIVLINSPELGSRTWRRALQEAAPEIAIEGRLGSYVTALLAPEKALIVAADPLVSLVRLPPSGSPRLLPADDLKNANRTALRATGLDELHRQGRRGKNVRTAVISGDFRGYEAAMKAKRLPKSTRLLDLTVERNPDLRPDPDPKDDGVTVGHGTVCAEALALAAPEADLLLIRVDPAALYQMGTIARSINEEQFGIESLDRRRNELEAENKRLEQQWKLITEERNILLQQFGDDEESKKKREDHFKKVNDLKAEDAAYNQRMGRFLQYLRDLKELRRLQVVVSTIDWHKAYPVNGSSPLARYLDDHPFRSTLWFQPAGDAHGQVWTGLFRDVDHNGAMEFAESPRAPARGLPANRWTREVNFLGWQPFQGKREAELPEKTALRITFQWTEAHESRALDRNEDLYRDPLAQVRLLLLKQRDPTGKKVGADEMEYVAQSSGPALRIHNQPDAATYQVTLDYPVEAAGHYALTIEGRPPTGIRLPGQPAGKERIGEFRPQILLEVRNPEARALGRPVFIDYASDEGTIGTPGDGQSVFTVGAATAANLPRPTTSLGPALGMELQAKPNFFSYDGLPIGGAAARGSTVATSFAAGLTASVLSNGVPPDAMRRYLSDRPEGILRVPRREPGRMPAAR